MIYIRETTTSRIEVGNQEQIATPHKHPSNINNPASSKTPWSASRIISHRYTNIRKGPSFPSAGRKDVQVCRLRA